LTVGPWFQGSAIWPWLGCIIRLDVAGTGTCADAIPAVAPSVAALASKSFRM